MFTKGDKDALGSSDESPKEKNDYQREKSSGVGGLF
jgi:hypothetical protein